MNKGKLNRIWLAGMALVLASMACIIVSPPPVTPTPAPTRQTLITATVQIYGLFNKNGQLVPGYVG